MSYKLLKMFASQIILQKVKIIQLLKEYESFYKGTYTERIFECGE